MPAVLQPGFNPRAREGRDDSLRIKLNEIDVSIRAPVRGATAGIRLQKHLTLFQSARP